MISEQQLQQEGDLREDIRAMTSNNRTTMDRDSHDDVIRNAGETMQLWQIFIAGAAVYMLVTMSNLWG
jgi:hypothetical protein